MDRRATLATLFGRQTSQKSVEAAPELPLAPPLVTTGLDPYEGPWEFEQAAHLLRRATFGPSYQDIKNAVEDGLETTFSKLFEELPLQDPPLNFSFENDPFVNIGETWIDAPYLADVNLRAYRNQSLRSWNLGLILNEGISIREKMVLFWHNHYVTAEINDPKFIYRYITTLRENALGNFRELTKQITIDPTMLRYLNGRQNTATAPNENYARELLELFTIGKGPAAGPGDYTNYTEEDVIQMARVLTGWRDVGFNSTNPDLTPGSVFVPNRHDSGDKQLSHRFDDVIISDMGENEHEHLVDLIFQKDEVARFICRKLYRWFIYYVIDEDIEANVIEPMSQILIESDYDIQPAIEALLRSEHFFDMLNVGPMIKNPIDFVASAIKQLEMSLPPAENIEQYYRVIFQFVRVFPALQMEYFNPPTVAGWKAYYQEPQFYRIWINSVTLPLRMDITNRIAGEGIMIAGWPAKIYPLTLIQTLDDPFEPNNLINELASILFPQPITEGQVGFLKEILIPGLPDYEWTVEYGDHLNNPDDEDLAIAVENKLRNLIQAMMNMPEFYLS